MEDGDGSTAFATEYGSGSAATFSKPPSFAQDGLSFPGSDALPQLNGATITALVSSGATPTDNVTRYALAVPGRGDSNAGTSGWNISQTNSAGTIAQLDVFLNANGTLSIEGFNSAGTMLFDGTTLTNVQGKPVLVSAELTPSGGNINWALRIISPGGTSVIESVTGTNTGSTGAVSEVLVSRAGILSNTTFGQLAVFYAVPPLTLAASALGGYSGEYAVVRFQRLCTQFNIPYEVIGSNSAQMGPQADDTLANLLQSVENTDGGLLYESRDQFGLGYRTLISLQNQAVRAAVSYSGGQLGAPLASTYDDQLLVNQWSVTNWDGYSAVAQLVSGALSVQPVPAGVGLYAAGPVNVVAFSHAQVNTIALQNLLEGTVNDVRYPQLTVNFLRPQAATLFASVPGLRYGDHLQLSGLPAFDGSGSSDQMMWGYTETLNAFTWTMVLNTIPEEPWNTSYNPGTYTVVQAPSGTVSGSSSIGSSTSSTLSGSQLPDYVLTSPLTARSIGGVTSFIASAVPYDWSFNVSGTPADGTYFICTNQQAVPIAVGDTFTSSGGFGGPFTVTALAPPSGGNTSVYFTPTASQIMSSGIVYGGKNGDTWVNTSADNQIEQWENGAWTSVQFGPQALSFTAGGATVTVAAVAPGSPAVGDIWYDTSNGYRMNQWTGSAWVPYQYGPAAVSITSAEIGGVTIFVQTAAPTANNTGDLWYKGPDATGGYSLYQWNGSAWVAYQFGTPSVSFTAAGIAGVNVFSAPPTPYDWTFSPVSGTTGTFVTLASYATGSTPMSVGDTFTSSAGRGGPFTITAISAPSGADVTVTFTPTAGSSFTSGDTLTGGTPNDLWFNTSNGNALSVWSAGAWGGRLVRHRRDRGQLHHRRPDPGGTITASLIATGTITATQIAAGRSPPAQIATGTITATQIAAGTITASQIAAGTIIAGNIAAGTITAAQIDAGTAVTGILDSTTIQALQYIATGTQGEFLAYAGTPGSGTLIASLAGFAGSDGYSNAFAEGVTSLAVTLINQSSAPAAFTGGSQFYSTGGTNGGGRPFWISSSGDQSILERSIVNVFNFTMGNTSTPTAISASATYAAYEGNQSSEYEIEIDGDFTTGATTYTVNFQLYVDGSATGPHATIGGTGVTASSTYWYTVRARLAILDSATAVMTVEGTISKSANANSQGAGAIPINFPLAAQNPSTSFDYTLNHTFQMYGWFGGTSGASAQGMSTVRTKITKRN